MQSQLSAAKPVAVPDVVGSVERLAVQQIQDAGLKELVERTDNADVPVGQVFAQDPQPGDRTERGNFVTITRLDRAEEGGRARMSSAATATTPSRS